MGDDWRFATRSDALGYRRHPRGTGKESGEDIEHIYLMLAGDGNIEAILGESFNSITGRFSAPALILFCVRPSLVSQIVTFQRLFPLVKRVCHVSRSL
ncbi:MAG: hypothetical protein M1420_00375 [Actinobacteria bacterium]|nr:hypothetical protein [Actinomycetota bacterium]